MKKTTVLILSLMLWPLLSHAEEAAAPRALEVEKAAVGIAIDNKELSGAAAEFDSSITRVYCWTKVKAANPPAKVIHRWVANGKNEADVTLPVAYPATRTWSSKNVWPGAWKVEVIDEAGNLLTTAEFTVKAQS